MRYLTPALPLLLLVLVTATGCGPASPSQVLLGKWEGSPDSLAAKRDRNPIPTASGYTPSSGPQTASAQEEQTAGKLAKLQPSETTDLEAFDFRVGLEFKPQNQVVMTLNGGATIDGTWKVLSTDVGVSQIELIDGVPAEGAAAEQPDLMKRRYLLELDEAGDAFTLREEGVDPRFGWLYFRRVE
ncbi:hypothetical protein Pla123a_06860 [Posidoniimonas polymericola]|uniref:Lipoprotein n=1 Tax=Posidoniimonas polymericola TaxID=2528002 RepID=A0A5C5ZEL8_9BACT|nr:hypothetical protein [Posidoniimonas polymericola]TWT85879.1 hypothetical protein Pla123a_06860 [Posidoniimonas polymericola]